MVALPCDPEEPQALADNLDRAQSTLPIAAGVDADAVGQDNRSGDGMAVYDAEGMTPVSGGAEKRLPDH